MTEQHDPVIEARGLTRYFGRFAAVREIDLVVRRGEVFGLLGANGAGKTTAIRMLCGTLPPTSGQVHVGSIDMVRHARRARSHIGYVTQRFALYGDLTIMENLTLQAGLYGLHGTRAKTRLDWALERLNLSSDKDTRAARLPLGYQRRLSVAAALLHEPDVLFLDEPTSGIDPFARQQLWELVYELAEGGIGVLVTTHYMDEALFCDRLALMHAGRIVTEGTPEELLARPLPTPIIEVYTPACPDCARLLAQWDEVREVIPHAERLRLRLQSGASADQVIKKIRTEAERHGVIVGAIKPAPPELEDVFVAVLEGREAA